MTPRCARLIQIASRCPGASGRWCTLYSQLSHGRYVAQSGWHAERFFQLRTGERRLGHLLARLPVDLAPVGAELVNLVAEGQHLLSSLVCRRRFEERDIDRVR